MSSGSSQALTRKEVVRGLLADTLEAQKTFGQYTECLGFLWIFFSRN